MIESGRVVAIEVDALWVETQQKTTCGNCSAQQGCGQSLLQQLYPGRCNHLRVLLATGDESSATTPAEAYSIGDWVDFSLPDNMIVKASLLLYLLPVLGLLLGAVVGGRVFVNELAIIGIASAGFCIAAISVRLLGSTQTWHKSLQPQLVGHLSKAAVTSSPPLQASAV